MFFCRLCAETRNPDQIKATINDAGWNIEAKLTVCCQWNPLQEGDALPKEVCDFCFEKLEQCWNFSQSVAAAQIKLHSIYGKYRTLLDFKLVDLTNAISMK